jgi:hypothetical protein
VVVIFDAGVMAVVKSAATTALVAMFESAVMAVARSAVTNPVVTMSEANKLGPTDSIGKLPSSTANDGANGTK